MNSVHGRGVCGDYSLLSGFMFTVLSLKFLENTECKKKGENFNYTKAGSTNKKIYSKMHFEAGDMSQKSHFSV